MNTSPSTLTFATPKALADWLRSRDPESGCHIVGIDGMTGSGKSTLARCLGAELDCAVLDCDWFLWHSHRRYPRKLGLGALARLVRSITESKRRVIIEGVALLKVTRGIGLSLGSLVYVRHICSDDSNGQAQLLDGNIKELALLRPILEIEAAMGGRTPGSLLEVELVQYHKRAQPHLLAQAIYERHTR